MDSVMPTMVTVVEALKSLRIALAGLDEAVIEERVVNHLHGKGIPCARQVSIGRCRVDILIEGGIVLELKKQRPRYQDVIQQLQRYALTGKVRGLVLILERHVQVPEEIEGIPCMVVSLNSQWGIAL